MKYICFFCIASILFACTPQRPAGILSEKKMEDIMVDYHLALAMAEIQSGDLQAKSSPSVLEGVPSKRGRELKYHL